MTRIVLSSLQLAPRLSGRAQDPPSHISKVRLTVTLVPNSGPCCGRQPRNGRRGRSGDGRVGDGLLAVGDW
jgi:hypothetical protein